MSIQPRHKILLGLACLIFCLHAGVAAFAKPSRSRIARVASAAARASGLPPKVLACEPGTQSMISALAIIAPSGNPEASRFSMHAYGAQFVEARVDADSGEVRVPRMVGVFGIGRAINPKTARSQLIGGMTMGIGMALMEETVVDAESGSFLNHDLAQYHVATCADIQDVTAVWIDEEDPHLNPMGAKGVGEIGIVGAAAAIGNAVYHATGRRFRDLPITPAKLLS